jgi:flagellar basal-body rod modification protein FlgD
MDVPGIRTLSDVNTAVRATTGDKLGRDEFLKLMVAQLKHQDPMNPSDSQNFLAQLAQFSTLEGIQNLNTSVDAMAGQLRATTTMQATSLVGHAVLVPTDQVLMQGNGLAGNVNVTDSTQNLQVEISDLSGTLVKRMNLGPAATGDFRFQWDGTDAAGNAMPPGVYKVKALSSDGSTSKAYAVDLPEVVMSVSLGASGVQLNLSGGSTVAASDVKEIQ